MPTVLEITPPSPQAHVMLLRLKNANMKIRAIPVAQYAILV